MSRRYDAEITDRRRWRRFQIQLRCLLLARPFHEIPAVAENISRTGLLVRCYSADFGGAGAPGEPVQMQLEISSEGKLKKRILDCQGSVAWREAEPLGDVLLGLSVSKMRFRSTPQDGSPLSLWNSDGELVM